MKVRRVLAALILGACLLPGRAQACETGEYVRLHVVASSDSARGIQVDYLNGQETPTVRRMEVPGTLGFVWDMYLDWGISVRDFRGIARNDGEALPTV